MQMLTSTIIIQILEGIVGAVIKKSITFDLVNRLNQQNSGSTQLLFENNL